jgi:prepilin-type N-terminal cleavage/methylation domain-containing protein
MTKYRNNSAFTLIEMITVIAIIVILASLSAMLLLGSDDRAKSELTKQAFGIIDSALEEYRDFVLPMKFNAVPAYAYLTNEFDFYKSLKFPPDANGFFVADELALMDKTMGINVELLSRITYSGVPTVIDPAVYIQDLNYSGSQIMYFYLSQVPQCRNILAQLPKRFVTNLDKSKNLVTVRINGNEYPFYRIVDTWGTPLRYDYYVNIVEDAGLGYTNDPLVDDRTDTLRTFPIITSAGPDRLFGTGDDIKNK